MATSLPSAPLNDNALPHPVLDKVGYGAPLIPDLWNGTTEQIEANFAHLAGSLPRVVPYVSDLAALTNVSTGAPFALVLGEFSLWLFLRGDDDETASELEFFNRLRRVGVLGQGGAWYEVVPSRRLQFSSQSEMSTAVAAGQVLNLLESPLQVYTDGNAPLVINLNVTGSAPSGAQLFVEVVVDGTVTDYLQIEETTGPALHLYTVTVPPAGDHAVSARVRSIIGTSYVDRFTLSATAA